MFYDPDKDTFQVSYLRRDGRRGATVPYDTALDALKALSSDWATCVGVAQPEKYHEVMAMQSALRLQTEDGTGERAAGCHQRVLGGAARCDACGALDASLRLALRRHEARLQPLGGLNSAVELAKQVATEAGQEPVAATAAGGRQRLEWLVKEALKYTESMVGELEGARAALLLLQAQLDYWRMGKAHRWHPVCWPARRLGTPTHTPASPSPLLPRPGCHPAPYAHCALS